MKTYQATGEAVYNDSLSYCIELQAADISAAKDRIINYYDCSLKWTINEVLK